MAPRRLSTRLPQAREVFSGIGFRLTASYALAVLIAVTALSVTAAIAALSRGERDISQTAVPELLQKDAAGAGPYLTANADALRYWVVIPALQDLTGKSRSPIAVAVLDSRGRLIVADGCTRAQYAAASATNCRRAARALVQPLLADPSTRRLLEKAAHGTATTGSSAGRAFAAAPILNRGKEHGGGGALVAAFAGALPRASTQSTLARFLQQWKASLPRGWLWIAAITLLLGTAAGALLSGRHVRRVARIAAVARDWSRGELNSTADASGRDELSRLAADLNQMAEQLRNLLHTRSQLATREERRRLQRDLHDGIKQELFATSMQLATARASLPPDADALAAALDHAHASCRRAQHELAALLDQAVPQADRANVEAALSELAQRLGAETGIAVTTSIEPDPSLSNNTEQTIYRVTQEAFTNIRRHAQASTVTLTLENNATETRLRIGDNGRGFEPDLPRQGMGLQTMRERVEALGGKLVITSNGSGTSIDATLPRTE